MVLSKLRRKEVRERSWTSKESIEREKHTSEVGPL